MIWSASLCDILMNVVYSYAVETRLIFQHRTPVLRVSGIGNSSRDPRKPWNNLTKRGKSKRVARCLSDIDSTNIEVYLRNSITTRSTNHSYFLLICHWYIVIMVGEIEEVEINAGRYGDNSWGLHVFS